MNSIKNWLYETFKPGTRLAIAIICILIGFVSLMSLTDAPNNTGLRIVIGVLFGGFGLWMCGVAVNETNRDRNNGPEKYR